VDLDPEEALPGRTTRTVIILAQTAFPPLAPQSTTAVLDLLVLDFGLLLLEVQHSDICSVDGLTMVRATAMVLVVTVMALLVTVLLVLGLALLPQVLEEGAVLRTPVLRLGERDVGRQAECKYLIRLLIKVTFHLAPARQTQDLAGK